MHSFNLSEKQTMMIAEWALEQDAKAIEKQKELIGENAPDHIKSCWEMGMPYYGAAGGVLTYSFTPTSLGVGVTVKNVYTNEEIDVTDYEDW